ncbi:MAG: CRISPR system precrRNA processing endoribonuclease RAMP protein Cas6 [Candidatus Obscuribacterales bacterium]|nr:CRISPR system precrRNA processing endoribonuclease RAMP protein Cas6 [Candidatus Obscuribacterales bacterium]
MLIEKYEMKILLDSENDPLKRSPARGALMHGVLMQALQDSSLHQDSRLRPYSQNLVYQSPGEYKWTINVLNDAAAASVSSWLLSNPSSICIEHYELELQISKIEKCASLTYVEFLEQALSALPPKYASFEFLSPFFFKKARSKMPHPYPEARLILQNALAKWNEFSDAGRFAEPEILEEASQHISLQFFRLHSKRIDMDGIKFSAAEGSVSFKIQKTELRQLMHLAGKYAEFAGLGAKTALGLGAVRYTASLLRRHENASSESND